MDVQHVPDDMEFAVEDMTRSASEVPQSYTSRSIKGASHAQTKVRLAWDSENPHIREPTMGAHGEMDYSGILASSASESEHEEEERRDAEAPGVSSTKRDKYTSLLQDDLQVANGWRAAEGVDKELTVSWAGALDKKEEEGGDGNEEMTLWEKYQKKRADRRRQKRASKQKGEHGVAI